MHLTMDENVAAVCCVTALLLFIFATIWLFLHYSEKEGAG